MARTPRTSADPSPSKEPHQGPQSSRGAVDEHEAAGHGDAGHDADAHGAAGHAAHDAHEIHLPPNSWTPVALALALTIFFVGFLIGPAVWIIGALLTAATLVGWARAAITEYSELPD